MSSDEWSVANGTCDGKPIVVRTNEGVRGLVGDPTHTHQIGIAVPFNSPRPDGLPSEDDQVGLDAIEDRLAGLFSRAGGHLFVMVITTNGMREFVVYTRHPDAAQAQFEVLHSEIKSHEIQFMIQPDPEWNVYKNLSSGGS